MPNTQTHFAHTQLTTLGGGGGVRTRKDFTQEWNGNSVFMSAPLKLVQHHFRQQPVASQSPLTMLLLLSLAVYSVLSRGVLSWLLFVSFTYLVLTLLPVPQSSNAKWDQASRIWKKTKKQPSSLIQFNLDWVQANVSWIPTVWNPGTLFVYHLLICTSTFNVGSVICTHLCQPPLPASLASRA